MESRAASSRAVWGPWSRTIAGFTIAPADEAAREDMMRMAREARLGILRFREGRRWRDVYFDGPLRGGHHYLVILQEGGRDAVSLER